MKNSQLEALRGQSIEELEAQIAAAREELFKGRFKQAVEGESMGVRARATRRQIARLLTIINSKKAEA